MQTRVKFISLLIAGVVSPLLTMSPATPSQQTTPGPAEPPVVSPSAEAQKSLDRAAQYTQAKQPLDALNAADEALSMSKERTRFRGRSVGSPSAGTRPDGTKSQRRSCGNVAGSRQNVGERR